MTQRSPDAPADPSSRGASTDAGADRRPTLRTVLVVAVAAAVLAAGGFAPVVVAQDGAPTVPAAYYGDVTVNGDPAPAGTEIVAVVDGEEYGSIEVETEGQYGGPDALDEKLVVEGAEDGDTVSFEVRGVAAAETVEWESGDVQEVDLTFEDVPGEPDDDSGSDDGGGDSAPAGGGGGGAGAAPSGDATATPSGDGTTTETPEAPSEDVEVVRESSANISTDSAAGGAQVTFEDDAPVSEIRFEGSSSDGTVSVAELSDAPTETGDPPGESVVVSEIQVPDEVEESAATLRLSVSDERLASIEADAEDLRVNRFADGEWQSLETSVVEETADGVVVEADTPGFSYFAVSAVGEPTAELRISPERVSAGSEVTLNGSASTDPRGEIVAYEWSVADRDLTGATTTLQVAESGEYTVELTVTNDAGRTDTTTATLVVDDEAEQSTAGGSTASLDDGTATDASSDGVERESFGGLPSPLLLGVVLALLVVGIGVAFIRTRDSSSDERL